ncbi:MAG: hypothetical protein HYV90_00190 [Candidatus Woesebacteria bacterium]|nr:MAG: hypothetical protein HYV90_00190 [Candidatus Woesebacteria bacterium]
MSDRIVTDLQSRFIEKIARDERSLTETLSLILTPSELEERKKFRRLMSDSVYNFSPYRLLPEKGHKLSNFLFGKPVSSSNMNQAELRINLELAKQQPWDIFSRYKQIKGSSEFRSESYQLESIRFGSNRGNYLHFEPYNIDNDTDPLEFRKHLLEVQAPITHPMYIWMLGTKKLIYAVENKLLKLTAPGIITAKTNTIHATFLKNFGFEDMGEGVAIEYPKLRDKFQDVLANDERVKRIVSSGESVYQRAHAFVPEYLDLPREVADSTDFWKWYFKYKQ